MAEPDLKVIPKVDDMFVILPILRWGDAKTYGSAWFGGQLMTGAELVKYAVSKLNLSPLATVYQIANAFPSDKVIMMLTNPCAPKED